MTKKCKVCDQLLDITPENAKALNEQILNRTITASYAATLFKDVGVSTVKKHRSEQHLAEEHEIPALKAVEVGAKDPKGWEPYIETHGDMIGEAILRLPTPGATEKDLLITAGFDPDEWKIKGHVNTRKWMRYDGEWLYYYKFDVEAGESVELVNVHVDELVNLIREKTEKSRGKPIDFTGTDTYVVALADWQIGKSFNGNGTPETVARVKKAIDESYDRFWNLVDAGHHFQRVALIGLGDLVENCDGHYASQSFITDCNIRDQNRITRELLYYAIDKFYGETAPNLLVACIGGNHGQIRKDGKAYTDDADNMDVAVFETIREAYDRAGVNDIEWIIPQHDLSLNIDLDGIQLGVTHGHLFRNGASAQIKAKNWWQGQVFGYQNIQNSKILLSGHYHHHSVLTYGLRTHIQTAAMDCGSKWFADSSGEESPAGLTTFRVTKDNPYGWDDLKVMWADA